MGFNIYHKELLENGNIRLSKLASLTLSGPRGLIAKFLKMNPGKNLSQWKISTSDIPSIVGLGDSDYEVIYTCYDEKTKMLRVSKVLSITGSSQSDETEVIMKLGIIENICQVKDPLEQTFEINYNAEVLEFVNETFSIDGGSGKKSHSWLLNGQKTNIAA